MSSIHTQRFNETLRSDSPKQAPEEPVIEHIPSALTADKEVRLEEIYLSFASRGLINGAKFAKFMRDNKLLNSKLSATDVDLIFAKATPKGARKIDYERFRHAALPMIAEKRGSDLDKVLTHICEKGGGPVFIGTIAEKVRHHDDKSTYTGVYAKGGPTNAHDQITIGNATSGFKSLLDRSSADVRGRKLEESREAKIQDVRSKSSSRSATFVKASSPQSSMNQSTSKPGWNEHFNSTSFNPADEAAGASGGSVSGLEKFMLSLNIPAKDAAIYTTKLKDDGFDVVSDLKSMSEKDFSDIGMKKGHLRKVLHAAQSCP